eukprot:450725-Hanusia_phi.AAC.5
METGTGTSKLQHMSSTQNFSSGLGSLPSSFSTGYGKGAMLDNRFAERTLSGNTSSQGHQGYMYKPLTSSTLHGGNQYIPSSVPYATGMGNMMGAQGMVYGGMGAAANGSLLNAGFSHLSVRDNSQLAARYMPGASNILTEDSVPDPVKHKGTSLGVEVAAEIFDKFDAVAVILDKNGILPNDSLLSCAEAVWDALHYDGPKLTEKQKQDLKASKKTNIDDPGAEFVTFGERELLCDLIAEHRTTGEFLLWYEDSLERLTGPPVSEVSRPISSSGLPSAYSTTPQYLGKDLPTELDLLFAPARLILPALSEQAAALARLETIEKVQPHPASLPPPHVPA